MSARPAAASATTSAARHHATTARTTTVVLLHAHPDDEAIFTGATMRLLADAGARVVLVTATSGGAGIPRMRLAAGESLQHRRISELERACELLGVARLDLLGYGDSGAHVGPYAAGSLGATPARVVAGRLATVVERECADAVVHYDPRGIYGHVDHVQVHRVGALVAERYALPSYEATVDAQALRRGPRHVLQQAAGEALDVGVDAGGISFRVEVNGAVLTAKHAAMAAHASQIGPQYLDPHSFRAAYSQEWYVRRGSEAVLEPLLNGAVRRSPVPSAGARPDTAVS